MRVGISGTHGTGKTTLAGGLRARPPGHVLGLSGPLDGRLDTVRAARGQAQRPG